MTADRNRIAFYISALSNAIVLVLVTGGLVHIYWSMLGTNNLVIQNTERTTKVILENRSVILENRKSLMRIEKMMEDVAMTIGVPVAD